MTLIEGKNSTITPEELTAFLQLVSGQGWRIDMKPWANDLAGRWTIRLLKDDEMLSVTENSFWDAVSAMRFRFQGLMGY
jgi:hypothetical protein